MKIKSGGFWTNIGMHTLLSNVTRGNLQGREEYIYSFITSPTLIDADDIIAGILRSDCDRTKKVAIVSQDLEYGVYAFNYGLELLVFKRTPKQAYKPDTAFKQTRNIYRDIPEIYVPQDWYEIQEFHVKHQYAYDTGTERDKRRDRGLQGLKKRNPFLYSVYWDPDFDRRDREFGSAYEITAPTQSDGYWRLNRKCDNAAGKFAPFEYGSQRNHIKTMSLNIEYLPSNCSFMKGDEDPFTEEYLRGIPQESGYGVEADPKYAERVFRRCAVLAEAICGFRGLPKRRAKQYRKVVPGYGDQLWSVYVRDLRFDKLL